MTNTGARAGAEIVQLYVHAVHSSVSRPENELKGFARVSLQPGETKRVRSRSAPRAFSYYSPERQGWVCEAGDYTISVGRSSRDLPLHGAVSLAQGVISP